MNKNLQYINPIQNICNQTPPLVWAYYIGNLNQVIYALDIDSVAKVNFTQTIRRYAEGERSAKAIKTINIHLRRAIQAAWAVQDSLFEGTPEQQHQEATRVAQHMTAQFETLFNQQKAHVYNSNLKHTSRSLEAAS